MTETDKEISEASRERLEAPTPSLSDTDALQVARVEIARLEQQIGILKDELTVSVSDRVTSHVAVTQTLLEERVRLAAVTSDLNERLAQEHLLAQRRAALQRDRKLIEAETVRLAIARKDVDAAQAEANDSRAAALAAQSSIAWRAASAVQGLVQNHPRTTRLLRRTMRLIWWTATGRLVSRLRERRPSLRRSAAVLPHIDASASDMAIRLHAAGDKHLPVPQPPSKPAAATLRTDFAVLPSTGHRPAPVRAQDGPHDGPLVSVVITSFNYGRSVTRAVDSILAQTCQNLEVIVVEGGSSDPDSRLVVARMERPRVRVLMQGGPHGAGANRNFGISQSRGRYICCLDADDTLSPTYIEKAVFLLERQGYDVVSSALQMVGEDHEMVPILARPDLSILLNGNHVLTSAVFRRAYWDLSGGYRDVDKSRSGHIHEDWAFWIRIAALGARFYNLHHDPMLRYTVHRASLSRGDDVVPLWRQRRLVRQMNADVLERLDEAVALSRNQASRFRGTPATPPSPILLDRERKHHRPTVLLALPYMLLGGAERLLRDVVGHLVAIGWRVVIVTSHAPPAEAGDTTQWFEQHTAEIFKLPDGMPPECWSDFLHHLVGSRDIDLVFIVGSAFAYDSLNGLRAAHPALRVVDLLFNTMGHTANNRRRRDLIDLILVENEEVRQWLLARGEASDRIRLVTSGVDTAVLAPRLRSDALVAQIGAEPRDLIVGFSGRWSEEKNPLGFVEIARRVDPGLRIRFVMTGTGPLRSAIQTAIGQAGFAAGKFHLLGEVDDIAATIGSFDLLVVPSTLDGRPMVVLEALALGVPVLASRVGALPELIANGETGWLCDTGDDAAFAGCIEAAAANREQLQAMRAQARAFSESHLNLQGMLTSYTDSLRSLLPEDRRHV